MSRSGDWWCMIRDQRKIAVRSSVLHARVRYLRLKAAALCRMLAVPSGHHFVHRGNIDSDIVWHVSVRCGRTWRIESENRCLCLVAHRPVKHTSIRDRPPSMACTSERSSNNYSGIVCEVTVLRN